VRPNYLAQECVAIVQTSALGGSVRANVKRWVLPLVGVLVSIIVSVCGSVLRASASVLVWVLLAIVRMTRAALVRLPAGTSLTPSHYIALLDMIDGKRGLKLLYRSSRDGTSV